MGEAILRRMLEAGAVDNTNVSVADRTAERLEYVASKYGVNTGETADIAATADVVILGVKPQQLADMPAFTLKDGAIIISMLAGTSIETIKPHFTGASVARIMPNLGFAVGHAVIGLFYDQSVEWSAEQKQTVHQLMSPGGLVVELDEESKMNEITAVSGSGPAYFYWFSEQMVNAAKELGFSEDEADKIVRKVFIGVAKALEDDPNTSPAEFRQRVTSKAGTTEAALNVFSQSDVGNVVLSALEAARDRSRELSA